MAKTNLTDPQLQAFYKKSIDVVTRNGVGTVNSFYAAGLFDTPQEAKGAFKIAYQQGMDGMGPSVAAWMGLTEDEFSDYMRHDALPTPSKRTMELFRAHSMPDKPQ